MANYKVGFNRAANTIWVAEGSKVLPGGLATLGTFTYPVGAPGDTQSFALFHYVQDIMYKAGEQDMDRPIRLVA